MENMSNDDRLDAIDKLMESINENSQWCPMAEVPPPGVTRIFTEMLTFKQAQGKLSEFAEVFCDENLHLVFVPEVLRIHLESGDTFLMTLGLRGDLWTILFSSPAYSEEEDYELIELDL